MLNRLLRLLSTGLSTYSFYANPARFIVTLVGMLLIPYLAYIFWGTLIIVALAGAGLFFIYKTIRSTLSKNNPYHY